MNSQTNQRVLARELANELTVEELAQVSGGACRSEMVLTWDEQTGSDAEARLVCDF